MRPVIVRPGRRAGVRHSRCRDDGAWGGRPSCTSLRHRRVPRRRRGGWAVRGLTCLSVEFGTASCHSRGMTALLPLANLLVVSLEQAVAAPYCSSRLADAGARVIKIERAGRRFRARLRQRRRAACPATSSGEPRQAKPCRRHQASQRRGTAASVSSRSADVFIQNLAPGAAARAGFGSDTLRERHPRLITC